MRDVRINLIIEGTSEIMHLLIAREAMDPHLRRILPMISAKTPMPEKIKKAVDFCSHYGTWLPRQWLYLNRWKNYAKVSPVIKKHIVFIEKAGHRLARELFLAMAVHQQGLEKRQQILFRFVNIGTDLFAMAASCSRAAYLTDENPSDKSAEELADLFCKEAGLRIQREFKSQRQNDDKMIYKIGRNMLDGKYQWLETGIVK